jgi:hypothetical protein
MSDPEDVNVVTLLGEPGLEFRYDQRVADPHAGLSLFGPYDADLPAHPKGIVYGLIGTPEGIDAFEVWSQRIRKPILTEGHPTDELLDRKQHALWPSYPGFDAAFDSTWHGRAAWTHRLNREALLHAARDRDPNHRAYQVVNLYQNALRIANERDEAFNVIVCVVPDEVWLNCRPLSRVKNAHGTSVSVAERELRRTQPDLFGTYDTEEYALSVDFRRQLKARAMEFDAPIQIVRESTVTVPGPDTGARNLSPAADLAWNLTTTLFYKAGGKPWRLATARDGVCYVGLAFRRTAERDGSTACCAAQMFLDTGDGVVFRGEFGPWYSPENRQYHLTRGAAADLMRGVLTAYAEQGGRDLKEIFLHSRSTVDVEEFDGYCEGAAGTGARVVGIRVRRESRGIKIFRWGKWPVLRGTFWKVDSRAGYLWSSGFKPSVLSYDGAEVPVPLRIDIQHGEADIRQVATDILGLTKLNYNACKVGDSAPVTIGFSDAVGEILVSNPTIAHPKTSFKFYI